MSAPLRFCQPCQLFYTSSVKFHHRTVHQMKMQATYDDGRVLELLRDAKTAQFTCYCKTTSSADPAIIRAHARTHGGYEEKETQPRKQFNNLRHLRLHYNMSHKFLICTICHIGIVPADVVDHVRSHRDLDPGGAEYLRNFLKDNTVHGPGDPMPPPPPMTSIGWNPIKYLKIQPGFVCLEGDCGYAARSSQEMYDHSRSTHPNNTEHRSASIQTFFDSPLSPCFEVEPPSPGFPVQILEALLAENEIFGQELDESSFVSPYTPQHGMHPWLWMTRFPAHLADIDTRQPIARTIISNHELQQKGVISTLADCVDTIFFDIRYATIGVPQDILTWLGSDSSTDPSGKPLVEGLPEPFTWNRCVSWWSRFFAYIYSVYTDIQNHRCDDILRQRFEQSFDKYTWNTMSELFVFVNDPDADVESYDFQKLMMTFIMAVLKQSVFLELDSVLLHFLAVVSIHPSSGDYLQPHEYQHIAEIFLHSSRMIFLHRVFRYRQDSGTDTYDEIMEKKRSQFQRIRKRYLIRGTTTVVNVILRWLSFDDERRYVDPEQLNAFTDFDIDTLHEKSDDALRKRPSSSGSAGPSVRKHARR